MWAKLEYLRARLRTSFWLVPGVMTIAAVVVALGMLWLETMPVAGIIGRWLAPSAVGADGARLVLSTIAGSMITVASLVFSMTLVALTLAASNIGARLIDTYVASGVNQVALGLFLATFVYSLIVLRSIIDDESTTFVPHLAVSVAMLLAILSFGWLIYFIHNLAKSIQVDTVVARAASELGTALERMRDPGSEMHGQNSPHAEVSAGMPCCPVGAGTSGYIQAIDTSGLITLAEQYDVIIEMLRRPGHFVIPASELARVAGRVELDERLEGRIRGQVILGPRRTPTQDVEFSITLLVEIAARALSPGINDFYTAIACVDHLTAAMAVVLKNGLPSNLLRDDLGRLRVQLYPITFEDLADAAFHPIRQDARNHVAVSVRLLESLTMLAPCATTAAERDVLRRHGSLITADALQQTGNEEDRRDIEIRTLRLQDALGRDQAAAS